MSPWRLGNVAFEQAANDRTIPPPPPPVLIDPTERQISPQIAAVLLSTPRPELTGPNAQIVDALKAGCPGYALMRSLMMGFRAVLKQSPPATTTRPPIRTVTALHQWMDRARASGIALIQHFESRLQRDILAVEAAVTDRWSNGPVEGQVNRLKTHQAPDVRARRGGTPPRPTHSAACRVQRLASGVSQSPGMNQNPNPAS